MKQINKKRITFLHSRVLATYRLSRSTVEPPFCFPSARSSRTPCVRALSKLNRKILLKMFEKSRRSDRHLASALARNIEHLIGQLVAYVLSRRHYQKA